MVAGLYILQSLKSFVCWELAMCLTAHSCFCYVGWHPFYYFCQMFPNSSLAPVCDRLRLGMVVAVFVRSSRYSSSSFS